MKTWLLVGVLFLATIVVVQNSEAMTLRFLFWNVVVSGVVVLLLALVLGILIGFLGAKLSGRRPRAD